MLAGRACRLRGDRPRRAAANTWEGVWNTDFGQLTMSAGGSGSYVGPTSGTISGPAVGNVNEGTWSQAGDPPKSGKYRFELGGQSFTGTWSYDTGGCGVACGWNGVCAAGACLENGVGGGGGGDDEGGNCKAPSGSSRLLAATRDDMCPGDVKFSFRTYDDLPDKPGKEALPFSLLSIEARGRGTLSPTSGGGYIGAGAIGLTTTHAPGFDERQIETVLQGPVEYSKKGNLRKILFTALVQSSGDPFCDAYYISADDNSVYENTFEGELRAKGEKGALRLENFELDCLSKEPLVWKSKSMKNASIKAAKP